MTRRWLIHSGKRSHNCKPCNKWLGPFDEYKENEQIHAGLSPLKSKHCDNGGKPHKCNHCDKRFRFSSTCKNHERTHTGEKPHKCKYCDKWFSRSSNCKRHERTHTGEKPYKCKYCGKWFIQSSNFKIHEQRHTGEMQTCGKSFCQLGILKEHKQAHLLTTFSCWICQEELRSQELLIEHYDNHMGRE